MAALPTFRRGQTLSDIKASDLNAIVDAIRARTILPSNGVLVRSGSNGVTLSVDAKGSTAVQIISHPFKISSRQDPEDATKYLVTVEPGTINNVLPSNVFNGAVGLREFSAESGVRYVVLNVSATPQGSISSCTLSVDSSVPGAQTATMWALPETFKVLLGVVYETSVKQLVFDNLTAAGSVVYSTIRVGAGQFELKANDWYIWNVS